MLSTESWRVSIFPCFARVTLNNFCFAVTTSGDVVLTVIFTRPSTDGTGYQVTLRGLNVTCAPGCSANSGMVADVVSKEDDYDWGSQVLLSWNGKRGRYQNELPLVSVH